MKSKKRSTKKPVVIAAIIAGAATTIGVVSKIVSKVKKDKAA